MSNLLAVAPENPIIETLKWKTDVMSAKDGTEQRVTTVQFARSEHAVKFVMNDDTDLNTFYNQLMTLAEGEFDYPLWQTPIYMGQDLAVDGTTTLIDTTVYDIQAGDTLLFCDRYQKTIEIATVLSITGTNLITLAAGVANNWSMGDPLYRVTTCYLPVKPEISRPPFGYIDVAMTLRITEFRQLFTGMVAAQEIAKDDVLPDRVLSASVYTLLSLPIVHARPIITNDELKETFDWNIDVIDFDTGAFEYFTLRPLGQVNMERKFYLKNALQKNYWNWVLNWCHGQRRAVWVPTWEDEIGPQVLSLAGSTITTVDESFFDSYGDASENSHRGVWITDPTTGMWIARYMTTVAKDGQGHTIIVLNEAMPDGFPINPENLQIGFLIQCRQGTDEVQLEHHSLYSFKSTSYTSTRAAGSSSGKAPVVTPPVVVPPTNNPPEEYAYYVVLSPNAVVNGGNGHGTFTKQYASSTQPYTGNMPFTDVFWTPDPYANDDAGDDITSVYLPAGMPGCFVTGETSVAPYYSFAMVCKLNGVEFARFDFKDNPDSPVLIIVNPNQPLQVNSGDILSLDTVPSATNGYSTPTGPGSEQSYPMRHGFSSQFTVSFKFSRTPEADSSFQASTVTLSPATAYPEQAPAGYIRSGSTQDTFPNNAAPAAGSPSIPYEYHAGQEG